MINNFETASYLSTDALRPCEPRSRFGIDPRRDSSSIHANDHPSSYESNSTLVGNEGNESRNENGRNGNLSGHRTNNGTTSSTSASSNIGNTNIDDSIIMTRLRKSFEQKEEFLRRPSQPIGWFLPDERSESPVRNNNNGTVIPREFYARPQKFQKQVWPPTDSKQDQQLSILKSGQNSSRTSPGKLVSDKSSSNQNVQRMKSSGNDGAEEIDYLYPSRNEQNEETSSTTHPLEYIHQQIVTPVCDRLSTPSSCDDSRDSKESDKHQQQLQRNIGKSSNFVGTLSRIHENIASVGALLSGERQSIDARNGASSLPSSPGPEKKMNDKFPVLPQGLQIVSKRAKQFESGRLLSDDDEPTGDRTNLYRSELSRLSNKRSVPNVAVRKREFESKAEAQEPRRLPPVSTRETKSLDSGEFFQISPIYLYIFFSSFSFLSYNRLIIIISLITHLSNY